jgi:hypothetical protein
VGPQISDRDAGFDRAVEAGLILRGAGVAKLHRRDVELLEDPWNRGQIGRAAGDQLGQDLCRVPAVIDDRRAQIEGGEDRRDCEDMGEREEQVGELVVVDEPDRLDRLAGRRRVGVGENDTLGRTGRAGGVDDRVGILRTDGRLAFGEDAAIPVGAAVAQFAERQVTAVTVDRDQVYEFGQLLAHRRDLRELRGVLAVDRTGIGVAEHPLALTRGIRRVHGHDHAAGGRDPVAGDRPLRPRVRQQADALTRRDPERDQAERHLIDRRARLRIGLDLPLTVDESPRGLVVGEALGGAGGQRRDRERRLALSRGHLGHLSPCLRRDVHAHVTMNPPRVRRRAQGPVRSPASRLLAQRQNRPRGAVNTRGPAEEGEFPCGLNVAPPTAPRSSVMRPAGFEPATFRSGGGRSIP